MRVTFKLTEQQTNVAKKLMEEITQRDLFYANLTQIEQQYYHLGGNLLGRMLVHQYFNTDQNLSIYLWENRVEYVGQRYPMCQDGALSQLVIIAGYQSYQEAVGDNFRKLDVSEYETSNTSMNWWENSSDYCERLQKEEVAMTALSTFGGYKGVRAVL